MRVLQGAIFALWSRSVHFAQQRKKNHKWIREKKLGLEITIKKFTWYVQKCTMIIYLHLVLCVHHTYDKDCEFISCACVKLCNPGKLDNNSNSLQRPLIEVLVFTEPFKFQLNPL